MRPNPVALVVFSLAAAPVLAQGVSPADRYGASTPHALPLAVQGPVLNWAGKAPVGQSASPGQAGAPQLIPGGLLAHSSVVAGPFAIAPVAAPVAPVLARPQVAAPKAPTAPAPLAAARASAPAALTPGDLDRLAAAAPDGLLGVAPPVRDTPAVSGAL